MVGFQGLSKESKQKFFQVIVSFSMIGIIIINFIQEQSRILSFIQGMLTGLILVFGISVLIIFGKIQKQNRMESKLLEI